MLAAAGAGVALTLFAQKLLKKPHPLTQVEVPGVGLVDVKSEKSGSSIFVTLDWTKIFGKLPFKIPFCSACISPDGSIAISGTIGLQPPTGEKELRAPAIVEGGPKAEAFRTMELIEACLKACGAGVEHITMVHIYQVNYNKETFAAMNAGYLEFWDGRPLPPRITVGCSALALGSTVEIDVLAKL